MANRREAQSAIDSNADVQRLLAQYAQERQGKSFANPDRLRAGAQTAKALQQTGLNVPDGFEMDLKSGQLHENNDGGFLDAPAWAWALPAAGAGFGLFAAPAINGAMAAGAAGGATGSALPAAAGGAGAAGAAGAAGSGGLSGALKGIFTNPSNLMDLGAVIAALAGGARGGNNQANADAQRLNQITEQRMRRVDPLHQAVTQLAWGRLPMNARQGIAAPTYQPLT
jgi:hypothetical protein